MAPQWYESFSKRLQNQDVIIVFGSVLDRFPMPGNDSSADGDCKLSDAIKALWKGACSITADEAFKAYSMPNSTPDVARLISDFSEDVKKAHDRQCHYFEHTPAIYPRVSEWIDGELWRSHTKLVQAVQDAVAKHHKVVFVFPNEAWIPPQFLETLPGVCRFHVPRPDQQEREEIFRQALDVARVGQGSERPKPEEIRKKIAREAAALSEGLAWADLRKLQPQVTTAAANGEEIAEKIKSFRYGVTKDSWSKLRKDPSVADVHAITKCVDEPVLGQPEAVAKAIKVVAKSCYDVAAISTPEYRRPRGVLFFVGPTGVGKTMLAKKLAKLVFGSPEACIVLDMSEYSQEHAEARLIGAPPGYVGYSEGGQLTSAVRERPFSVVLFDEIDKAHPSILKKFLQILDEGRLTDGKGQSCDFSQSLIVFTSNQCSQLPGHGEKRYIAVTDTGVQVIYNQRPDNGRISEEIEMPNRHEDASALADYYRRALLLTQHAFRIHPEILNRIGLSNIIPFRHLDDPAIAKRVVADLIARTKSFFLDRHGIKLEFIDPERVAEHILASKGCDFANMGVRNVKQQYEAFVLEPLALEALRQQPSELFLETSADGSRMQVTTRPPEG